MAEIFRIEPGLEVRGIERGWDDYLVYAPRTAGFHWISRAAWQTLLSASGRSFEELLEAELARARETDADLLRRRVEATVTALIATDMLHAEIA